MTLSNKLTSLFIVSLAHEEFNTNPTYNYIDQNIQKETRFAPPFLINRLAAWEHPYCLLSIAASRKEENRVHHSVRFVYQLPRYVHLTGLLLKFSDGLEMIAIDLNSQLATLQLHDAFGYRQSETRAFRISGLITTCKAFEDFIHIKVNLIS